MTCPNGLSSRNRLLVRLLKAVTLAEPARVALFEDLSALARAVSRVSGIVCSKSNFIRPELRSGAEILIDGTAVVHQDMKASSYLDGSFDIVMHSDVLEHVPDHKMALRDNRRILDDGGLLLFVTPFFTQLNETEVLAIEHPDGSIEHLTAYPEYHGDPIAGQILAYYHFGWSLLEDLRSSGFRHASIVVEADPFSGLVSNNNPQIEIGNMLPVAIIAEK